MEPRSLERGSPRKLGFRLLRLAHCLDPFKCLERAAPSWDADLSGGFIVLAAGICEGAWWANLRAGELCPRRGGPLHWQEQEPKRKEQCSLYRHLSVAPSLPGWLSTSGKAAERRNAFLKGSLGTERQQLHSWHRAYWRAYSLSKIQFGSMLKILEMCAPLTHQFQFQKCILRK